MDIEKLKALALAANSVVEVMGGWLTVHQIADGCTIEESAEFIETCSPAAVLELIAEVERLRADAARYRHLREAQWFKAGFARTEANASSLHYCGELLDKLVDAAIEKEKA
jgi:hypothetical protein